MPLNELLFVLFSMREDISSLNIVLTNKSKHIQDVSDFKERAETVELCDASSLCQQQIRSRQHNTTRMTNVAFQEVLYHVFELDKFTFCHFGLMAK